MVVNIEWIDQKSDVVTLCELDMLSLTVAVT